MNLVNVWKSLSISAKSFISNIWLVSEYTSEWYLQKWSGWEICRQFTIWQYFVVFIAFKSIDRRNKSDVLCTLNLLPVSTRQQSTILWRNCQKQLSVIEKETSAQAFSCNFSKTFKSSFFIEHARGCFWGTVKPRKNWIQVWKKLMNMHIKQGFVYK